MTEDISIFRPENPDDRWTDGMRTEPARIAVRTEWRYYREDPRVIPPEGRTRHAFYRGGFVTDADVVSTAPHHNRISDYVNRAVEQFGDDKDLIIEVRLADSDAKSDPANSKEVLSITEILFNHAPRLDQTAVFDGYCTCGEAFDSEEAHANHVAKLI